MLLDLTTNVAQDSPLVQWAKSQDNQHIAMGHVGTHLDTYEKSEIPLEYFACNGIMFDVRAVDEVQLEDISFDDVTENSFVIFRTGQMEQHSYGDKKYFDHHPQLSKELIYKLIDKKIRFIGVDCPGIRQHEEHEQADRLCEKNGIYVIENLSSLSQIDSNTFKVYTMWIDDNKMTGLKCKVIIET